MFRMRNTYRGASMTKWLRSFHLWVWIATLGVCGSIAGWGSFSQSSTPIQGANDTGKAPSGYPVDIAGWDGTNAQRMLVTGTGAVVTSGGGGGGSTQVEGRAPTGGPPVGNPLVISGTDGSGNLQLIRVQGQGDATSSGLNMLISGALGHVFNGTNWDRIRSASNAAGTTGTGLLGTGNLAFDGTNFQLVSSLNGNNDANSTGKIGFVALNYPTVFNGANWDRARTPNIFKSVTATASGNTPAWTPTAGKKFRLMRWRVEVPANTTLAARGILNIGFQDSATDLNLTSSVYLGQTAIAADTSPQGVTLLETGWCDLGNGILSAAANNVLNVNLSAAATNGLVRVDVCGTEE